MAVHHILGLPKGRGVAEHLRIIQTFLRPTAKKKAVNGPSSRSHPNSLKTLAAVPPAKHAGVEGVFNDIDHNGDNDGSSSSRKHAYPKYVDVG